MTELSLGTISGIVTVTGVIVEVSKRFSTNIPWMKKVPVWVYASVISALLCLLANKVITTQNGTPLLEGNIWQLLWSAVVSAAGASGFYTWLKNPESMTTVSTFTQRKKCP